MSGLLCYSMMPETPVTIYHMSGLYLDPYVFWLQVLCVLLAYVVTFRRPWYFYLFLTNSFSGNKSYMFFTGVQLLEARHGWLEISALLKWMFELHAARIACHCAWQRKQSKGRNNQLCSWLMRFCWHHMACWFQNACGSSPVAKFLSCQQQCMGSGFRPKP